MPATDRAERLLFCADNLLDPYQYKNHSVVADQEAEGYPWWRMVDWRRDVADAWRGTTANQDRVVTLTADELAAADFFAVDRESNHVDVVSVPPVGKQFQLVHSQDNFVTPANTVPVFDMVAPVVPGGSLSDPYGALTDEGAWLRTFALQSAYYWRLTAKAQGSGLIPQLTGVWLGKSWQPSNALLFFPTQDRAYDVTQRRTESAYGWVGRERAVRRRVGELHIKPADEQDHDAIEWQVLGLFANGVPAWIVHDKVDGSRDAFLAFFPGGRLDFGKKQDWRNRWLTIPFEEDQPK